MLRNAKWISKAFFPSTFHYQREPLEREEACGGGGGGRGKSYRNAIVARTLSMLSGWLLTPCGGNREGLSWWFRKKVPTVSQQVTDSILT